MGISQLASRFRSQRFHRRFFIFPLLCREVEPARCVLLAGRCLPVLGEGQCLPPFYRTALFLSDVMGPATAVDTLCCTQHDKVEYRSEEHTSELQSRFDIVCRLLLEKKNT